MNDSTPSTGAAVFATTQWTVVLEAARPDAPDAQAAFAQLYRDYWHPLYCYVRRRGHPPAEAEDITQAFFLALLEKRRLAGLEREGGKFRSFLLTSLKNHLANAWDRAHAARRGGGQKHFSIDELEAETRFLAQGPQANPDLSFERDWAFALIETALHRLALECAGSGKQTFFEAVRPHLQSDRNGRPYAELAAELGVSEGALKVAIHRLRQRYGVLLREEISRTVTDESQAKEELRHLIEVVGRAG